MRLKTRSVVLGLAVAAACILGAADGRAVAQPEAMIAAGQFPTRTAIYPAPWPSEGSWISYTNLASNYSDPPSAQPDDSKGQANVPPDSTDFDRGTSGTEASVYLYYDAVNEVLFFRVRTRGDPIAGGKVDNYTWNALFDVEGNGFKRFITEVNGKNNGNQIFVGYGDTDSQQVNDAGCVTGEGVVWSTPTVVGTNVRSSVAAGGGYFFDWQVPLSAYDDCNGNQVLTPTSMYSVCFTTSTTHMEPTQKDFSDKSVRFDFGTTVPGACGDPYCPICGPTQDPVITNQAITCTTGGTNFSPITVTAYVMDALDLVPGSGLSYVAAETISSVSFYYRRAGTVTWNLIGTDTTAYLLNQWSVSWVTSGLAVGTYELRTVVTDDQLHVTERTGYYINLSTCGSTPVTLDSFEAVAKPGVVQVGWKTATEIDDIGFYLWKSALPDGPFVRVPGSMITAKGGTTWGAAYGFDDFDVQENGRYYYKLEAVDSNAMSRFYGPVPAQRLFLQTLAPSRGASFSTVAPATFEWNASGLDYFRVEISPDPSFAADVTALPGGGEFNGGGAPYQSFTPSRTEWARFAGSHAAGATYFWKVVGRDVNGTVAMTPPSDFRLVGAGSTDRSRGAHR